MSNAPRYRLVGYDIGTAPDENGGWVHWTDHEAEIARLTADLAESRAYALAQFFAGRDAKMSKKPERIWARPDYNECWHKRLEEEDVEYVRADLYAAQAAEIARLTAERDAAILAVEMSEAAAFSAGYEAGAEAHQAALVAAVIAALHDIDDLVANSKGVSGLHLNGDMAPWSEIMDGGAYGAWLQSVERLREAIRAMTPPADLAARIGGAA